MTKRPTAIHLDRLAQSMSRYGYKPKRHELLDIAASAFGYRNNNEFAAANLSAPTAEPIGTIAIQGSTIVLARDTLSDAIFAVEETFLEQVSAEQRAEIFLPTPYGHLADITRLLNEPLTALDQKAIITKSNEATEDPLAYVIETIDHNERLYWSNKDGWVDLKSSTRFPDQLGNLPIGVSKPIFRTVAQAKGLQSQTENWVGVADYGIAKKIVAELITTGNIATATFTPQVWVNDYAMEVDAEGPMDYDITLDLVAYGLRDGAETIEEYLDGSDKDEFQTADSAYDWISNWSGPFEINLEVSPEILLTNLHQSRARFT